MAIKCYQYILLFVLLCGFPGRLQAQSRIDCPLVRCVSPEDLDCKYGYFNDPCKCCPECYKGPEEECGCPCGSCGTCAPDLICLGLFSPTKGCGTCYKQ